ncbi:MAG: DUF805 domain-containing protein [Elusimicrobia bacterium]|nr:DUF805 domain-containing protein [Elusimicrobiota bacterium]
MEYYLKVLRMYAVFEGRARRKEYWMFVLVNVLLSICLAVVEAVLGTGSVLAWVYSLALLVPSIAVACRRLHDTGRSGWWQLIILVPLLGAVVLIYFLAQDGRTGDNEFGADPKAAPAVTA